MGYPGPHPDRNKFYFADHRDRTLYWPSIDRLTDHGSFICQHPDDLRSPSSGTYWRCRCLTRFVTRAFFLRRFLSYTRMIDREKQYRCGIWGGNIIYSSDSRGFSLDLESK